MRPGALWHPLSQRSNAFGAKRNDTFCVMHRHLQSKRVFSIEKHVMPMVNNPSHQTSTQEKAPAIISTAPHVHQRITRANTQGMLSPCSRVMTPPTSRVTTPPTQPAEEKSHPPDWYESPRGKRARTRVRIAQKEEKFKTLYRNLYNNHQ